MKRQDAHARFERLLARAMRAEDPVLALREASRNRGLDAATRKLMSEADANGVRISALLVARLRFERLLRGSPEAEAWFDADPRDFARAFRQYHREVTPTAHFPPGEAELFRKWRRRRENQPL